MIFRLTQFFNDILKLEDIEKACNPNKTKEIVHWNCGSIVFSNESGTEEAK